MHLLSGSSFGNEEVVAYVYMVILSSPNREELTKVWPVFSDVVVNKINFTVSNPQPKEVPASPQVQPQTQ